MARTRSKQEVSAIVAAMGIIMTIVQALLELVRQKGGSDEDIYRLATPNGKGLLEKIADLIVEAGRATADVFKITVDYSQSLAAMIKAGHYDWVNRDVTVEHFPIEGKGKVDVEIILVHLGRVATIEEVEAELEKLGLRSAKIEELLALGAARPELQREFPIVALGSRWRDVLDNAYVAVLGGDGRHRGLNFDYDRGQWHDFCRFAAVRK